jgi:hypothetical protein
MKVVVTVQVTVWGNGSFFVKVMGDGKVEIHGKKKFKCRISEYYFQIFSPLKKRSFHFFVFVVSFSENIWAQVVWEDEP